MRFDGNWPWDCQALEASWRLEIAVGVLGAGVIGAGASIISSQQSANAAKSAANTQSNATNQGIAFQRQVYDENKQRLQPFVNYGSSQINPLLYGLGIGTDGEGNPTNPLGGAQGAQSGLTLGGAGTFGGLTAPFQPTQQQLEQTPGYQFTLGQGLNAINNQYASQGQGAGTDASGNRVSNGPLGRALADYTTGLASNTFQQQFQDYLASQQQVYGMLSNGVNLGENAAAQSGNLGNTSANSVTNLLTGGANAQAAGTVGAANANSAGISGVANSLSNSALLYGLYSGGVLGGKQPASTNSSVLVPGGQASGYVPSALTGVP